LAKKKKLEKAPREMTRRQVSRHKKQQRRQRIIFFSGIAIIVAVVAIIVGGWFMGEYIPLHTTIIEVYDTGFDTAYLIDTMVIYARQMGGAESLADVTNNIINQIMFNELIKQEAAKLGITVSDEEAKQLLGTEDVTINDAMINIAKSQILQSKLRSDYFDALIPQSDNQVDLRTMMVESDAVAQLVREKILNGENFTELVEKYAVDSLSISYNGSYGFHPSQIFTDVLMLSSIPVDYAFSADVKAGDVSMPLSDNESFKNLGYWLIRINERPTTDTANVSAVYLSSEEEALTIKARLEAGEELGPIVEQYSQYSTSIQTLGEMGIQSSSDNISNAYNGYVFNEDSVIGEWSEPISDTFLTKGGSWLAYVVDKEENMQLTDEDKNKLIEKLYNDWTSKIYTAASPFMINSITYDLELFAIEHASREL
jgi:parvulin-like peptidyl-prolyl isomerase